MEVRESLDAMQAVVSNSQNTGMLPGLVTNPKCSTIQSAKKKINSTPARPQYTLKHHLSAGGWRYHEDPERCGMLFLPLLLMNSCSLQISQTVSQTHSLQCGIVPDHPNLAHHIPQTQKELWILACAAQCNWAQKYSANAPLSSEIVQPSIGSKDGQAIPYINVIH